MTKDKREKTKGKRQKTKVGTGTMQEALGSNTICNGKHKTRNTKLKKLKQAK